MKGIIGLDIDGTIVGQSRKPTQEVIDRLAELSNDGWQVAFLTGRTFPYGFSAIKVFPFSYTYVCYNGAMTLKMPEKQIIRSHTLSPDWIPFIEAACNRVGTDCFIHLGVEHNDACYYKPKAIDHETSEYLLYRRAKTTEPWIPVDDFAEVKNKFCYAKAFGTREAMQKIERELSAAGGLHVTAIDDPLRPGKSLVLVTHAQATKGGALRELRLSAPAGVPVIAAGDDYNDITMLEEADIGIAMETGPESLKKIATLIAPSIEEAGILKGLSQALESVAQ